MRTGRHASDACAARQVWPTSDSWHGHGSGVSHVGQVQQAASATYLACGRVSREEPEVVRWERLREMVMRLAVTPVRLHAGKRPYVSAWQQAGRQAWWAAVHAGQGSRMVCGHAAARPLMAFPGCEHPGGLLLKPASQQLLHASLWHHPA
jgi:hypothetical protein